VTPFAYHPEALAEAGEAVLHYNAISPDLARSFADRIDSTVARICDAPESFREFRPGIRQATVPRFPFAILYAIEPSGILIVAVRHLSRDPDYWSHRTP
jgi:plasmid stabilization system protein ParE